MAKYTIGVDFGQISGRAILVNVANGEIVAAATYDYPNGIMTKSFVDGSSLPENWALSVPNDYLEILSHTIHEVLTDINPDDVIGLGVDMSSCCMMPVKADGTPLCNLEKFQNNPYAYASITRNHSAEKQAKKMQEVAQEVNFEWLKCYNNHISSEWLLPKILKVFEEAPNVYREADYFVEVVDWIVWQLTGNHVRNTCSAYLKGFYMPGVGYPSKKFFSAVNKKFENVAEEKLSATVLPSGNLAGNLTRSGSKLTGLLPGTSVSVGIVDIRACVPAVKAEKNNALIGIFGDSSVMINYSDVRKNIDGVEGGFPNALIDNTVYKADQNCVGRTYAWFLNNYVLPEYHEEAKAQNRGIYSYIAQKMMRLNVGENGLIALNWLDGNNAVLNNLNLSAMILGMTEQTKVEHVLRAIVESMAYDTKKLIEKYQENGVQVDEMYGVGTIAEKNPFIMQVYSDILQIPIRVSGTPMAPALGSAILGAVAAGKTNGGYDNIQEASEAMGCLKNVEYTPNPYNMQIYNQLYAEYCKVYDFFGKQHSEIMENLRTIKINAV